MASRPSTRGLATRSSLNKASALGLRVQNENTKTVAGLGLKLQNENRKTISGFKVQNENGKATLGLNVQNENGKTTTGLKMQNSIGLSGPSGVVGRPGLRDATNKVLGLKRKADEPAQGDKPTKTVKKRSAFGDITNALEKLAESKKGMQQKGRLVRASSSRMLVKAARPSKEPVQPLSLRSTREELPSTSAQPAVKSDKPAPQKTERTGLSLPPRVPTSPAKPESASEVVVAPADDDISYCEALPNSQGTVASQDSARSDLDESAAYVTASEGSPVVVKPAVVVKPGLSVVPEGSEVSSTTDVPEGVLDYDKEMESDPFAISIYAHDIFTYYKQREAKFPVEKYMDRQNDVSRTMRAILVDWMVEVQESFELNHETLYLGVKIVDLYLSKVTISRDILQLIGSTALFIACKFDERTPPYVDDFLYICDDAYRRRELIKMEIKVLKVIGFDLGIPLSYRFLRRYARCAKVNMDDLTLTRYILEMSLMEYDLIDSSDSVLAASALYLTRLIKNVDEPWSRTLEYYSGYKVSDLFHLTHLLHRMITQPARESLKTIRNKYSHSVFFEVAKIPIPAELKL